MVLEGEDFERLFLELGLHLHLQALVLLNKIVKFQLQILVLFLSLCVEFFKFVYFLVSLLHLFLVLLVLVQVLYQLLIVLLQGLPVIQNFIL